MPIKWRSKLIQFVLETTYGTDPGPAAADVVLAQQVELTPMEGNDVSREIELPYLGTQGTVPAELHAKIEFRVELAPSGSAGLAPAWGKLLRACGMAEVINAGTSVVYNPVTDGHESASLHVYVGETRWVMTGVRGTCSLDLTAQANPYIAFEFWGLFSLPSEEVRPAPDFSAWQRPQIASTLFTPTVSLDGVDLVTRRFMLDFGNAVEPRFLIGSEGILITQKEEQIEMTVEAVPLTTYNPFQAALNQDEVVVQITHGTGAGRISTIDVPKAQMQRPEGLENEQDIVEWPLKLVPVPTNGNDQFTLTLT
ncbi:MAG: phage tail tube protein [Paracoccaceae bacterium]|mgnify:CR=1 FL=1